MYHPTKHMVTSVIYEKKKGSIFGIIIDVLFARLGFVCIGAFFGQRGSFKRFRKYAPFHRHL